MTLFHDNFTFFLAIQTKNGMFLGKSVLETDTTVRNLPLPQYLPFLLPIFTQPPVIGWIITNPDELDLLQNMREK